jgi:hypothetical protein
LPRPSGGSPATRFVLTEERFTGVRRGDVAIEGLGPCLPLLGLEPAGG